MVYKRLKKLDASHRKSLCFFSCKFTNSATRTHNRCNFKTAEDRNRGVASFARSGGGAKLKSGGQSFFIIPESGDLQKKKKRSSPKSENFFWPKSRIQTFFPAKTCNFFPSKNTVGWQEINRGAKMKIGGALPPCPPAGDAPG